MQLQFSDERNTNAKQDTQLLVDLFSIKAKQPFPIVHYSIRRTDPANHIKHNNHSVAWIRADKNTAQMRKS